MTNNNTRGAYVSLCRSRIFAIPFLFHVLPVGKTRLIQQTLLPSVTSAGGYLLVGKYDPLQRPEPNVGLCSALTHFVTQVVERDRVKAVRQALYAAGVGENDWKVLMGMIPTLQQVFLDNTSPDCEEPQTLESSSPRQPDGALKRSAYVFLTFLRAISSLGVPIVLLLDDLHFADQCSMKILSNVVGDLANCPNLYVVVTYNGEHKCCIFTEALEKICESYSGDGGSNDNVTRVSVGNLRQVDVGRFLSDALDVKCFHKTEELAALVFDQTDGNVFFIMEFVKHLLKNKLLYTTSTDGRCFDVPAIKASMTTKTCHISDFLACKLSTLPQELQQFLKVASCCGTHVPVYLLECIYGTMTRELLHEASELELLKQDHGAKIYAFPHDIIRQVVYGMIPDEERAQLHLEIGRRIWNSLDAADPDGSVYVLISQFSSAKHYVFWRAGRPRHLQPFEPPVSTSILVSSFWESAVGEINIICHWRCTTRPQRCIFV
jgi:predicted ATPase